MATNAPASNGKAFLELFEGQGASGAAGLKGGKGKKIQFQFNPKELQIVKTAKWETKPSKGKTKAPPPEYIGLQPASMTLEMFLDAYDNDGRDVSKQIQDLVDACNPTTSSESGAKPQPPGVIFGWDRVYFCGYIESVTAKYTRFTHEGKPIRAVCTIALKEFPKDKDKQNPTSGGLAALGSRQVIAGETLPGIAYLEYGDPNLWRAIAEVNNIDNPMLLPPGTRLRIPASTDAAVGNH